MRWSPRGRMSDGGHTPHPGVCVCRLCVPSVLREFDREKLGCHFDAPPTGFVRWGCERVLRWRSRRLSGRSCAVLKSTADLQSGHPRGLIAAPKIAVFLWDVLPDATGPSWLHLQNTSTPQTSNLVIST